MKIARPITMGCALICAVVLAGCADTPARPSQPEVVAINATSASARVERVDQKQRQLTLKLQDGRHIELAVSPDVRNFAQIRRGDTVEVRYVESVLLQVHPKGTAAPTASAGEYVQGAPAGEKPAGVAVQEVNIVAKIVAIAADRSTVTLQGPRGRKVDIAVREPRRLDGVKVGDLVELTYRQGVAIEVSAPARK